MIGDGARTNIEDERDALRRSLEHAREQATHFNAAGQQWARDLSTAEVMLDTALALIAGTDLEHVVVSPMGETLAQYIERCLPGFAERMAARKEVC